MTKPGPTGPLASRPSSPQELTHGSNAADTETEDGFVDGENAPFGDDFDDFEKGEDHGEQDDFGDFDNEIEEAVPDAVVDLDQAQNSSISMEDPSSTLSVVSGLVQSVNFTRPAMDAAFKEYYADAGILCSLPSISTLSTHYQTFLQQHLIILTLSSLNPPIFLHHPYQLTPSLTPLPSLTPTVPFLSGLNSWRLHPSNLPIGPNPAFGAFSSCLSASPWTSMKYSQLLSRKN